MKIMPKPNLLPKPAMLTYFEGGKWNPTLQVSNDPLELHKGVCKQIIEGRWACVCDPGQLPTHTPSKEVGQCEMNQSHIDLIRLHGFQGNQGLTDGIFGPAVETA